MIVTILKYGMNIASAMKPTTRPRPTIRIGSTRVPTSA